MARKPGTRASGEFVLFNVFYEDGTQRSNRKVPAELLGESMRPLDCDEFVCGDSDDARAQAAALVNLLPGLRAIDVGPLSRARSIEHLTANPVSVSS